MPAAKTKRIKTQNKGDARQGRCYIGIEQRKRRTRARGAGSQYIMKQEKEAEVKEREVKVREQELMPTSANKPKLKNMRVNKLQKQNWSNANARQKQNSSRKHKKKPKLGKPKPKAGEFAQLQEAEAITKGRAECRGDSSKLEAEAKGLDQRPKRDEENARSSHYWNGRWQAAWIAQKRAMQNH